MNILVLCSGNSARSILLESILNTESKGRISARSAGSRPTGTVHPEALKLLSALGHDTSKLWSKSWDVFAENDAVRMDAIITVCGSAAGEDCPYWPEKDGPAPLWAHWGLEDPAIASEDDWERAFQCAYDRLHARATALLSEPFEEMGRARLQSCLVRIGHN